MLSRIISLTQLMLARAVLLAFCHVILPLIKYLLPCSCIVNYSLHRSCIVNCCLNTTLTARPVGMAVAHNVSQVLCLLRQLLWVSPEFMLFSIEIGSIYHSRLLLWTKYCSANIRYSLGPQVFIFLLVW